jgi:hypothetical protein
MEIKKGLSFQMALQNVKDNQKFFYGAIICTPLIIYAFIVLAENRIIPEKMAIVMSQGLFLGAVLLLWSIICGKYSKKPK